MTNVLVGVTGSVATIKLSQLISNIKQIFSANSHLVDIKVVATRSALHFMKDQDLASVDILKDENEWNEWHSVSDPVLHIELRNWADVFLIAPLDANTLAKAVNGICDNLLTCVLRAWDTKKHILVCPAMNTHMYTHPITAKHLTAAKDLGYTVLDPISKKLACGDVGIGAMAETIDIATSLLELVGKP